MLYILLENQMGSLWSKWAFCLQERIRVNKQISSSRMTHAEGCDGNPGGRLDKGAQSHDIIMQQCHVSRGEEGTAHYRMTWIMHHEALTGPIFSSPDFCHQVVPLPNTS